MINVVLNSMKKQKYYMKFLKKLDIIYFLDHRIQLL